MGSYKYYLFGALAVTCYAALSPIAKKLGLDIPKFTFIGITMAMLSALSFATAYFLEKDFTLATVTPLNWVGILIFTLINFVGFFVYLYAIRHMPVSTYQVIGLMQPVIGGIIAYFLLAEGLQTQTLVGFAVMAAGLVIALYRPVG